MSSTPCVRCGQAVPDGLLCTSCAQLWVDAIEKIGLLLPEVETAVVGMAKVTRGFRPADGVEDQATVAALLMLPSHLRSKMGRITLVAHGAPGDLGAAHLGQQVTAVLARQVAALTPREATAVRSMTALVFEGPVCPSTVALRADIASTSNYVGREAPVYCWHESCIRIRAGLLPPASELTKILAGHTTDLRRHRHAAAIVDDARRQAADLERALDNSDPDEFFGTCNAPDITWVSDDGTEEAGPTETVCGVALYAQPDAKVVACRACGAEYPMTDREAWRAREIRKAPPQRPPEIAGTLVRWGISGADQKRTLKRLEKWIEADRRLHAGGQTSVYAGRVIRLRDGLPAILADPVRDDDGKPLYRIGDVLDRIEAIRERDEIEAAS